MVSPGQGVLRSVRRAGHICLGAWLCRVNAAFRPDPERRTYAAAFVRRERNSRKFHGRRLVDRRRVVNWLQLEMLGWSAAVPGTFLAKRMECVELAPALGPPMHRTAGASSTLHDLRRLDALL